MRGRAEVAEGNNGKQAAGFPTTTGVSLGLNLSRPEIRAVTCHQQSAAFSQP